ncbi:MAG: rhodanese-like domain-containing protein [Candidatus Paceibacterota bacterium]
MNQHIKTIILSATLGALVGSGAVFISQKLQKPNEDELIKEFYLVENAVHVSPHHIRKAIMKGETDDFILIDLRSEEEYAEEHIVGAINVPAYKDREYSDYGAIQRIRQSVRELKEKNPEKDIIVYCYSTPCMTGRKVGKILAEDGIYVKHLGIGWNEWRHFWKLWNHPHEWEITDPTEYTASGPEPGVFKGRNYLEGELPSGCGEGELSC